MSIMALGGSVVAWVRGVLEERPPYLSSASSSTNWDVVVKSHPATLHSEPSKKPTSFSGASGRSSGATTSLPHLYCPACQHHPSFKPTPSTPTRPCLAQGGEGDCWGALPLSISRALQVGGGGGGALSEAFQDLCQRAGKWERIHLRVGQVIAELPPAAQLPRPFLPRGGAGINSGVSVGVGAGVGVGGSTLPGRGSKAVKCHPPWAPSTSDILSSLPSTLLRTFLCNNCACPHAEEGGHPAASRYLEVKRRPMELARGTRELEGEEEGGDPPTPLPPYGSPLTFAWVDWELSAEERRGEGDKGGGASFSNQIRHFWERRIAAALFFTVTLFYDASFANLNNAAAWAE